MKSSSSTAFYIKLGLYVVSLKFIFLLCICYISLSSNKVRIKELFLIFFVFGFTLNDRSWRSGHEEREDPITAI